MYSDWLGCTRESGAAFVLATVVVAMVCMSGVGENVSGYCCRGSCPDRIVKRFEGTTDELKL